MRRTLVMALTLMATTTWALPPRCPEVGTVADPRPKMLADLSHARAATAKARDHLARRGTIPPGILKHALGERARAVVAGCVERPDECFQTLLRADERIDDPCVERDAAIEGQVVLELATFDGGHVEAWTLWTGRERIALAAPRALVPVLARHRDRHVRVRGVALDRALLFEPLAADDAVTALEPTAPDVGLVFPAPSLPTTGPQPDLLVPITFDDATFSMTAEDLRAQYKDHTERFWATVSHGRASLPVTIAAPIRVAGSAPCTPGEAFMRALPVLDPLVDFQAFRTVSFVSNFATCTWGGIGHTSRAVNYTTADGPVKLGINQNQQHVPGTRAHERGHNEWLYHGVDLACGPTILAEGGYINPACVRREYGTGWTLMGQSRQFGLFGAAAQYARRWIDDGAGGVIVDPLPGRYTVFPVSRESGLRGLVFRTGAANTVTVEVRAPDNEFEIAYQGIAKRYERTQLVLNQFPSAPEEVHARLTTTADTTWQGLGVGEEAVHPIGLRLRLASVNPDGSHTIDVLALGVPDLNLLSVVNIAPPMDTVVSGTVTYEVTATESTAPNNTGVFGCQLFAVPPGRPLQTLGMLTTPPFRATWNSTTSPDGVAYLQAWCTDKAGNQSSSGVRVTVNNGITPTTTTSTTTIWTPTTTSTTLTDYRAVVLSDDPDPSLPGEPVDIVVGEAQGRLIGGYHVQISLDVDSPRCNSIFAPIDATTFTCRLVYPGPGRRQGYVTVWDRVRRAWAPWVHYTHDTVTTTTTLPPGATTTTWPSTTSTTTASTTSSTRPTTTSTQPSPTTTSTTQPPTCLGYRIRCTLAGTPCCSPYACRRRGGQRRCLP